MTELNASSVDDVMDALAVVDEWEAAEARAVKRATAERGRP